MRPFMLSVVRALLGTCGSNGGYDLAAAEAETLAHQEPAGSERGR